MCHGCKKNQPGSEREGVLPAAGPSWEQGQDRPTGARSRPLLCMYPVPWWPPKPLCGKVHLQSCNAPRPPAHPWDQPAPWAAPSTRSKAGGTQGGCKANGLGMPKRLFPLLSDLEVHFQPMSDGQNALLVSQLVSFGDEQQPFPPPGSGIPVLPPHPSRSTVLPGTAAWLPGRLPKS